MRDLETVFRNLEASPFRAKFKLNLKDRTYLEARGLAAIRTHAHDFIARRLAPALPQKDGRQTPMRGHPVFVAQHATATCCRGCLAKWHGIDTGRELSDVERAHVLGAIERWLMGELG